MVGLGEGADEDRRGRQDGGAEQRHRIAASEICTSGLHVRAGKCPPGGTAKYSFPPHKYTGFACGATLKKGTDFGDESHLPLVVVQWSLR